MNNIIEPISSWQIANRCIGDARDRIQMLKNGESASILNVILGDLIEFEEKNISYFKGFMEGLLRKDGQDIEVYRLQAETTFGRRQWFAIGVLEGAADKW